MLIGKKLNLKMQKVGSFAFCISLVCSVFEIINASHFYDNFEVINEMDIPATQPLLLTPISPPAQEQEDDPGAVLDWPNCCPDVVISLLKKLEPAKLGQNKKPFWVTYGKWADLKDGQKNNAVSFFRCLDLHTQDVILTSARGMTDKATKESKKRTEAIHKNDCARMLELKIAPVAQMAWTKTERPYASRAILDARNSSAKGLDGLSMSESCDGWSELAMIYNDYKNFSPQHRLLLYRNVNGVSTPATPYQAVSSEFTSLANRCFELNPTDMDRQDIIRTPAWLKEQWTKLRTHISYVFADFNRSGQNLNKDEADIEWMSATEQTRWIYHCNNGSHRTFPSVFVYAYGVLAQEDFNNLGRVLPDSIGIDNSLETVVDAVVGKRKDSSFVDLSDEAAPKKRKSKDGPDSKETSEGLTTIASVMRESNAQENDLKILEIALNCGDVTNKALANETLSSLLARIHSSATKTAKTSSL